MTDSPPPTNLGSNKAIAAGLAGMIIVIASYVATLFGIKPPPEVWTAVQNIVVTVLVYYVPHGGG